MDGDDDDDSKLFDLDDDDDEDDEGLDGPDLTTTAMDNGPLESVNPPPPKDRMIGEEEEGEAEEGMGNHPYNSNDWEDMVGEPEAEDTETSALLFDVYNGQDNENGDIDTDNNNEDNLNSLMDCGLEEVDDLLSMNGRLRVSGSALTPSEEASRNNKPSTSTIGPYTGQTVAPRNGTAPTGSGVAQQGDAGVPASGLHPKVDIARGTGAHAANILMSSTAPAGLDRSSFPADHPTPHVSESMLGGSPTGGLLRCNNDTAANNNNGDGHDNNADCNDNTSPNGDEHLVPQNNGPPSYCYDPRQDAAARRGGGGVRLLSPPRRPAKETAPFIRAKGLTLTYAQAKLFGLAGAPQLAKTLASKGFKAARKNKRVTTGSDTRTFPDENLQGGQGLQRHPQQTRTYSPSRMEHLARPVPGKGRAGGSGTTPTPERSDGSPQQAGQRGGRGKEARFTWKRSKRAEAAMRDPACGYDFVREAGYNAEGFLSRVEAYASYSRQKLETRRGEDLYASRVDKLECPQCHNPQSYDEFVSKKLKCGGCEVPYCMPRTWNRRVWDHRNELCAAKSEERRARLEREAEQDFLKRMPRQTRHAAMLRQRVGQVGFIRRMRRDLQRRRACEGDTKRRDINQHDGEDQQRHDDRIHRPQRRHDFSRRPASAPGTTARSGSAAPAMAARATASGLYGHQTTGRAGGGERKHRGEKEEDRRSLTTSPRRTTPRSPSSEVAGSLQEAAAQEHRYHHPARPITLQMQGGGSGRVFLENLGIDDDRGAGKRHLSPNAAGVKRR